MYSATSTCNIEIINNPSIRRGGGGGLSVMVLWKPTPSSSPDFSNRSVWGRTPQPVPLCWLENNTSTWMLGCERCERRGSTVIAHSWLGLPGHFGWTALFCICDAHNNRGGRAAIRAASCNFLSISNMSALTQRDRGSLYMLCALTDLINWLNKDRINLAAPHGPPFPSPV